MQLTPKTKFRLRRALLQHRRRRCDQYFGKCPSPQTFPSCVPGDQPWDITGRKGALRCGVKTRQLHFVQNILRPKLWGCVFNCPRKNKVNVCPNLSWPKLSRLQIWITDQIQITDPDYGSGVTDPELQILDYGSGLRNTVPDNFGNYRLKIDQALPHFYTENFSRDDRTNAAPTQILDKVYFGRSVIAGWPVSVRVLCPNFGHPALTSSF